MFRARVLRPLVWALPLLIVGWAAAVVLLFVPAHNGSVSCGSIMFTNDQYVLYGEPPAPTITDSNVTVLQRVETAPTLRTCNDVLSDRLTDVVLIAGLSTLPALVAGVRAVLWAVGAVERLERAAGEDGDSGTPAGGEESSH